MPAKKRRRGDDGAAVREYLLEHARELTQCSLDGPGWHRALLDYATSESPRRAAQLARLAIWSPPEWEAHFAIVDRFIAEICAQR